MQKLLMSVILIQDAQLFLGLFQYIQLVFVQVPAGPVDVEYKH